MTVCNKHPQPIIHFLDGGPCPLCEAETEIESLSNQVEDLRAHLQAKEDNP